MTVQQGEYVEGVGTAGNPNGGVVSVQSVSYYSVNLANYPGVGAQASVTAAGAAGRRNILQYLAFSIVQVAGAAGPLSIVVRDGASGVGTILFAIDLSLPATANSIDRIALSGLSIGGSVGNAMTVESTAAVAGVRQIVSAGINYG